MQHRRCSQTGEVARSNPLVDPHHSSSSHGQTVFGTDARRSLDPCRFRIPCSAEHIQAAPLAEDPGYVAKWLLRVQEQVYPSVDTTLLDGRKGRTITLLIYLEPTASTDGGTTAPTLHDISKCRNCPPPRHRNSGKCRSGDHNTPTVNQRHKTGSDSSLLEEENVSRFAPLPKRSPVRGRTRVREEPSYFHKDEQTYDYTAEKISSSSIVSPSCPALWESRSSRKTRKDRYESNVKRRKLEDPRLRTVRSRSSRIKTARNRSQDCIHEQTGFPQRTVRSIFLP